MPCHFGASGVAGQATAGPSLRAVRNDAGEKFVIKDDSPLVLPLAALFVAFFIAPLCVLIALSLSADANIAAFTSANYVKFFTDSFNYSILFETLLLGLKATLVCLIFGFPIAWTCARAGARLQSVIVFLVILPILTSVVVRTFAWIVILGRQGVINQVALGLGLTDEPIRLLFTEPGVMMVLAQVQMPLMVLPILTVLSKMDPNLADASRVLGAGEWRTLWRITVPLSLPGVIAGSILVYTACITAFVTQTLIGGARLIYMPLHIYQQAIGANNWPFAAALSVIFMVAVLIIVGILGTVARRSETYAA
jgi:putative spermidine/putrescine transport system permease protein